MTATLADDLAQPSIASHARSPGIYAAGVLLAAALLVLTPRVGSPAVALGGGIASGGSVATVLAGVAWRDGVPNPLVAGRLAFNVGDVAICAGVGLLIGGALLVGWTHRARLHEPL